MERCFAARYETTQLPEPRGRSAVRVATTNAAAAPVATPFRGGSHARLSHHFATTHDKRVTQLVERGGGGGERGEEVTVVVVVVNVWHMQLFFFGLVTVRWSLRLDGPAGTPSACSLRRQVPGFPGCKPHPTPSRGKSLRGRPLHPPLFQRKGSAIFSITSALDALDSEYHELDLWDVSSWLTGPSYQCYFHSEDVQEKHHTFYHHHFRPWVKTKGGNSW